MTAAAAATTTFSDHCTFPTKKKPSVVLDFYLSYSAIFLQEPFIIVTTGLACCASVPSSAVQ
jgi:hypothetical protein